MSVSAPPPSVSNATSNTLGFLGLCAGTAWMLWDRDVSRDVVAPVLVALTAIPILAGDLWFDRVHRRASTGIDWSLGRPMDQGRIATKWLGTAAAVGLILAIYALAPEYDTPFYEAYYTFLRWFAPPVAVGGIFYIAFLDRYLVEPEDKYWHLGAMLTLRPFSPDAVLDLVRGWVIKGFFIPLMYIYCVDNISSLRDLLRPGADLGAVWFDALWSFGFLVDVTFSVMGYLVSLRVFDTHLRSTEPTGWGWIVAMLCYQPFFSLVAQNYIAYDNGLYWGEWLAGHPILWTIWAVGLLATLVVFSGTTITFGCRFSNLTHRGILTNGFYRYTKHPAYWSKIISFFMIFIPFVYRGSVYDVVHDCVWLSVIGGVYWMRARTEEQHLSRDPDYVAYALWIEEHGIFRFLGRLLPVLRYRPPTDDR